MRATIPATFRLPATDPCFAIQPDPVCDAIGMALAADARLVLPFQHPGCAPDLATVWLNFATDQGLWYLTFASDASTRRFFYWPQLLSALGAGERDSLADRDDWTLITTEVTK
jgi:hypothetical protein